ncbi:unnamed protein product [Amoebophrya sp. A120]|nr:unnamed protein product [Amoebophrya sp. A120]|eukprot:GSA120T00024081001.1
MLFVASYRTETTSYTHDPFAGQRQTMPADLDQAEPQFAKAMEADDPEMMQRLCPTILSDFREMTSTGMFGWTVMHYLAGYNAVKCLDVLVSLTVTSSGQIRPLPKNYLVKAEHVNKVRAEMMSNNNADENLTAKKLFFRLLLVAKASDGEVPMHIAASEGNNKIIKRLLHLEKKFVSPPVVVTTTSDQNGNKPTTKPWHSLQCVAMNDSGETPLHAAMEGLRGKNRFELDHVATLIVEGGADPNRKTDLVKSGGMAVDAFQCAYMYNATARGDLFKDIMEEAYEKRCRAETLLLAGGAAPLTASSGTVLERASGGSPVFAANKKSTMLTEGGEHLRSAVAAILQEADQHSAAQSGSATSSSHMLASTSSQNKDGKNTIQPVTSTEQLRQTPTKAGVSASRASSCSSTAGKTSCADTRDSTPTTVASPKAASGEEINSGEEDNVAGPATEPEGGRRGDAAVVLPNEDDRDQQIGQAQERRPEIRAPVVATPTRARFAGA